MITFSQILYLCYRSGTTFNTNNSALNGIGLRPVMEALNDGFNDKHMTSGSETPSTNGHLRAPRLQYTIQYTSGAANTCENASVSSPHETCGLRDLLGCETRTDLLPQRLGRIRVHIWRDTHCMLLLHNRRQWALQTCEAPR